MPEVPGWARLEGPGVYRISVWVQPGAKADQVCGEYRGCLKIALRAPAVDNKANKALADFLAGLFGVPGRRVELVTGHGNRQKSLRLTIEGDPRWPEI